MFARSIGEPHGVLVLEVLLLLLGLRRDFSVFLRLASIAFGE